MKQKNGRFVCCAIGLAGHHSHAMTFAGGCTMSVEPPFKVGMVLYQLDLESPSMDSRVGSTCDLSLQLVLG